MDQVLKKPVVPDVAVDRIAALRVVPVVVIEDAARAADLASALVAGGLPLAEVTFRTPAALKSLVAMAANSHLCVGAGTVVTADQVDEAHDAGARFVVGPGLSQAVAARCAHLKLPYFPGVATATEIIAALELGLNVLKLFPAQAIGGMATLRALHAPFPGVRFIPTGGIDAELAPDYLRHPAVTAVGGSWMVPGLLVSAGDWAGVADLAAEAVGLARGIGVR